MMTTPTLADKVFEIERKIAELAARREALIVERWLSIAAVMTLQDMGIPWGDLDRFDYDFSRDKRGPADRCQVLVWNVVVTKDGTRHRCRPLYHQRETLHGILGIDPPKKEVDGDD
jgi:hypothetical protein